MSQTHKASANGHKENSMVQELWQKAEAELKSGILPFWLKYTIEFS